MPGWLKITLTAAVLIITLYVVMDSAQSNTAFENNGQKRTMAPYQKLLCAFSEPCRTEQLSPSERIRILQQHHYPSAYWGI
jgi:hypothetical protein